MVEEEILYAIASNKSLVRTKSKEETERDINESAEYIVDPVTKQKYKKRLLTKAQYTMLRVKDPGTEYVIIDGTDDADYSEAAGSLKNWLKVDEVTEFKYGRSIQLNTLGVLPNGNYLLTLAIGLLGEYTDPNIDAYPSVSFSVPISNSLMVNGKTFYVYANKKLEITTRLTDGNLTLVVNGESSFKDRLILIYRSLVKIV